jgi:hypothetical protein
MRIPVTIQTIMGSPRLNKVNNKKTDYSSFSLGKQASLHGS